MFSMWLFFFFFITTLKKWHCLFSLLTLSLHHYACWFDPDLLSTNLGPVDTEKTPEEIEEEGQLLDELLDVVEQRNALVAMLEEDRLRYCQLVRTDRAGVLATTPSVHQSQFALDSQWLFVYLWNRFLPCGKFGWPPLGYGLGSCKSSATQLYLVVSYHLGEGLSRDKVSTGTQHFYFWPTSLYSGRAGSSLVPCEPQNHQNVHAQSVRVSCAINQGDELGFGYSSWGFALNSACGNGRQSVLRGQGGNCWFRLLYANSQLLCWLSFWATAALW